MEHFALQDLDKAEAEAPKLNHLLNYVTFLHMWGNMTPTVKLIEIWNEAHQKQEDFRVAQV